MAGIVNRAGKPLAERAGRDLSGDADSLYKCLMSSNQPYTPFSQRTGLEKTPPQLKLGEVSAEFRRLVEYYIGLEIDRESRSGFDGAYLDDPWQRVAMDLHVIFFKQAPSTYNNGSYALKRDLGSFIQRETVGKLFDLLEFFVRHPLCSDELKGELVGVFVTARSAYRIVDRQIVAIGTDEQSAAFSRAVADAETSGNAAARTHLIASAKALRDADWAGSVRESTHAVEAMALRLAPGTSTLGPALIALERRGHLHGSLKAAFGALYGYSSDEEGVRHALVFKQEAQVDEADALFMLGACASFVSYLIMRTL